MRRLVLSCLLLAGFMLIPLRAEARQRFTGICITGNETINANRRVHNASCTVRVFDTGTVNLSTIFSDNAGTALANPFTAGTDGFYFFYADDGRYDVQMSAGTPAISSAKTIGDVRLSDGAFGVRLVVSFSATPTFDVSVADIFDITLTGNVTSSTISNPVTGKTITFIIREDATGGRTFAFPANTVRRLTTLDTTASAITIVSFLFDGTNWEELSTASDSLNPAIVNSLRLVDGNKFTSIEAAYDDLTGQFQGVLVGPGTYALGTDTLNLTQPNSSIFFIGSPKLTYTGTGCAVSIEASFIELLGHFTVDLLTTSATARGVCVTVNVIANVRVASVDLRSNNATPIVGQFGLHLGDVGGAVACDICEFHVAGGRDLDTLVFLDGGGGGNRLFIRPTNGGSVEFNRILDINDADNTWFELRVSAGDAFAGIRIRGNANGTIGTFYAELDPTAVALEFADTATNNMIWLNMEVGATKVVNTSSGSDNQVYDMKQGAFRSPILMDSDTDANFTAFTIRQGGDNRNALIEYQDETNTMAALIGVVGVAALFEIFDADSTVRLLHGAGATTFRSGSATGDMIYLTDAGTEIGRIDAGNARYQWKDGTAFFGELSHACVANCVFDMGTASMVVAGTNRAQTFSTAQTFSSGIIVSAGVFEYTDAPTLAASTTPSVTGGTLFLTANTASITDFTG